MRLVARCRSWPLRVPFVISRCARTHVDIVDVELTDGDIIGRGECQPNPRFGEDPDTVIARLTALTGVEDLAAALPGLAEKSRSAANALNSALLDFEAKKTGRSVWSILCVPPPKPVETVHTISLLPADEMAAQAKSAFDTGYKLLKLKLGAVGDEARMKAVRAAVPDARLVVDANEGWTGSRLQERLVMAADLGIQMVEQPVPEAEDHVLLNVEHTVPICADEACRDTGDLERLVGRYDMINIKLDKTGGVSAALDLQKAALDLGLDTMVGCMLCTSLGAAPAFALTDRASFVDLDGPDLLDEDRANALQRVRPGAFMSPSRRLWG